MDCGAAREAQVARGSVTTDEDGGQLSVVVTLSSQVCLIGG